MSEEIKSAETTEVPAEKQSKFKNKMKKLAPFAITGGAVTALCLPGVLYVAGSVIQYKTALVNLDIAELTADIQETTEEVVNS